MPCRVGITTDPDGRKKYWDRHVVGMTNWTILARYARREDAQAHETNAAQQYGCQAHAGGSDAAGTWHVYYFKYTRTK